MRTLPLALAALLAAPALAADVQVPVQLRVLDAAGAPVQGSRPVVIRLWSAASAGTARHVQDLGTVALDDGYLSAVLGAGGGLDDALFSDPLWVEVSVDEAAMGPRTPLASAPLAAVASRERQDLVLASGSGAVSPGATTDLVVCSQGFTGALTLPGAGVPPGHRLTVKNAATTGTCTVSAAASETIDGAASHALDPGEALELARNASAATPAWLITSRYAPIAPLTVAVLRANLNSASTIEGTTGARVSFASVENSAPSLISLASNGVVTFARAGVVLYSYHQDIIHSCATYAHLHAYRMTGATENEVAASLLTSPTTTKWDGISLTGAVSVAAGQGLSFRLSCSGGTFSNLDDGGWGPMTVTWIGEP